MEFSKIQIMFIRYMRLVLSCSILIISFNTHAQTGEGLTINGGLVTGYDSNIFKTSSELSVADKYAIVTPDISLKALYGKHIYDVSYKGSYKAFNEQNSFNFAEHNLELSAMLDHSYALSSQFNVFYQKQVEDASLNNVSLDGRIDTLEKFDSYGGDAKLLYGTRDSIGQIIVNFGIKTTEFESEDQAFRNVDENNVIGTFYYNLGPKLQALFEGRLEQSNYEFISNDIISQSNDSTKVYVGLEWQATAATSGTFRVGYLKRDFNDAEFEDFSGLSFIANLTWEPSSFTSISLQGSRIPSEALQVNVAGLFSNQYGFGIKHKFTPRLQFVSDFIVKKDNVSGSVVRTDKSQDIKLGLNYSLRRSVFIGVRFRYEQRESVLSLLNYNAKVAEFTITTKLN